MPLEFYTTKELTEAHLTASGIDVEGGGKSTVVDISLVTILSTRTRCHWGR
jgi:hypothetical protein